MSTTSEDFQASCLSRGWDGFRWQRGFHCKIPELLMLDSVGFETVLVTVAFHSPGAFAGWSTATRLALRCLSGTYPNPKK